MALSRKQKILNAVAAIWLLALGGYFLLPKFNIPFKFDEGKLYVFNSENCLSREEIVGKFFTPSGCIKPFPQDTSREELEASWLKICNAKVLKKEENSPKEGWYTVLYDTSSWPCEPNSSTAIFDENDKVVQTKLQELVLRLSSCPETKDLDKKFILHFNFIFKEQCEPIIAKRSKTKNK